MGWSGPTPDEAGYVLRQQRERAARRPGYNLPSGTPWLLVLGVAAVAGGLVLGAHRDPPPEAEEILAGTWTGELVQAGMPPYPLIVTFAADGKATIEYPTLPCTAVLTPIDAVSRLHGFREDVTAGSCASGEVRLTPNPDGSLSYTWSFPGETTTSSSSNLTRR